MLQWCILWDWLRKVKGGREVCHPSQIEQAGWLNGWEAILIEILRIKIITLFCPTKCSFLSSEAKWKKRCMTSSQFQITDITRENKSAQHLLRSVQLQTKNWTRAATPEPTLSLAGLFQQVLGFGVWRCNKSNVMTQPWWELCWGLNTPVGPLEPGTQPCSS